jgi:hypothetical protein
MGLGRGPMERKSSLHAYPVRSIYLEERHLTSDERLDENEGEPCL